MADRDAERLRREAQVRRSENAVQTGATASLDELRALAARLLREGNYDPSVLDARHPDWSSALEAHLLPAVTDAYLGGLRQEAAAGSFDATPYISRHLESVRNRLVGVADTTFNTIRGELQQGWARGDDIPTLAKSVDGLLSDTERWKNRATTIARTEVIGANNAGARDAAGHIAGMLGHTHDQVAKTWLATLDSRTRESHAEADGQTVMGLNTPFMVGGAELDQPGDPAGDPAEVVNCRCTATYDYPGDPNYPTDMPNVGEEPPPEVVTPGLLSPQQYEVMTPQSQWSAEQQAQIKETLTATPEGKALHAVLDSFQDGGSIARLRTAIGKRVAGETVPAATEAKVDALLDAIRNAPEDWAPDTLYRGMTVPGKLENVLAKYTESDHIDLSLTSFTSDRTVAKRFQSMTAKGTKNETRVMVELVGDGKKAVPIQNLARDRRLFKEKEWVSSGRYRVVEAKKSPSGGLILRVEQVETL